jgi:hypothetical protein
MPQGVAMLQMALALICLICLIGSPAPGQQTGTGAQGARPQIKERDAKADAATIDKLISQLGSRTFEDREEASKALEVIGLSALEPLRKAASESTDLEVRKRARDLVRLIEKRYEPESDFAWFDTLGFPDLNKSKYVRVATGDWFRHDKDPPQNIYIRAFLLSEHNDQFTIFEMTLRTKVFKKTPPGTPEHLRVDYEILDWRKEIDALLKEQEALDGPRFFSEFISSLDEPTRLFILARACSAAGNKEAAGRILQYARKLHDDKKTGESLRQHISDQLAHSLMWDFVRAFEDLSVSRKELLTRIEDIVRKYPESKPAKDAKEDPFGYTVGQHAKMARHYASVLKRMVREDEVHDRKPAKPEKEMTRQERLAELIFQLRDQNGHQFDQPGRCDIFLDPRGEKSPAHQLVAMGYDAVPQLIEVLDDDRLTRSVGYHRNFYFSHHVLRIGDCAEKILERIAGRSFWVRKTSNSAMLKDREDLATKKKIEAWWHEFQEKGEKQMLIDGVRSGHYDSPEQAKRLVNKYPDSAVPAIRQGVKSAPRDWTARSLVEVAAEIKGEPATTFLREQLHGSYLVCRVAAARGLLDRSRDEAIDAMIAEWNKARNEEGQEDLINFLLWCGKAEAAKALAKELHKRPINVGLQAIEAINSPPWGWEKQQKSLAPAAEEAIDEVLIEELDDSRERTAMSGSWDDKEFCNPRLCDLSGHVLAKRWKQPSWFDLSGSPKTRDRQRVELKNVWLKKRGKEPLPLPVSKKIEPLSNQQLLPLFQRLEAASSAEERAKACKRLVALGLPTLPAVQERLRALKPNDPAYADIKAIAAQMATIVDDVQFSKDSAPPPENLRKQVAALRGQPLTESQVVDLIRTLTSALPPGITGIKLSIDREGDGTGVALGITLTSKKISQPGIQNGWEMYESISVNGRNRNNSSSSCSREHGVSKENWEGFAEHLRKTLEAPPEHYISIRVGMIQGE